MYLRKPPAHLFLNGDRRNHRIFPASAEPMQEPKAGRRTKPQFARVIGVQNDHLVTLRSYARATRDRVVRRHATFHRLASCQPCMPLPVFGLRSQPASISRTQFGELLFQLRKALFNRKIWDHIGHDEHSVSRRTPSANPISTLYLGNRPRSRSRSTARSPHP